MNTADFEAAKDLCSLAHLHMRLRSDADYTSDEVFRAKLLLTRLEGMAPAAYEPTSQDCQLLATLSSKAARLIERGDFARGGADVERTIERLREVGIEHMTTVALWRAAAETGA